LSTSSTYEKVNLRSLTNVMRVLHTTSFINLVHDMNLLLMNKGIYLARPGHRFVPIEYYWNSYLVTGN